MTTYRRIPVTLVLVDTGPLITLAACNRLELLDVFSKPIRIVDVVRAECLRHPDRVGAAALASWFENIDGKHIDIVTTPFLDDWIDAVEHEKAGDTATPSKQIGDAAIAYVLSGLARQKTSQEIVLLLLEDSALGDGVIKNIHPQVFALSTRAFLTVLENYGIIPSAAAILLDVAAAGRKVAPYRVERPGRMDQNARSEWTSSLKRPLT